MWAVTLLPSVISCLSCTHPTVRVAVASRIYAIIVSIAQHERPTFVKRSTTRILTTHCGSLPRPRELWAPLHFKDAGRTLDHIDLASSIRQSVADVVRRQAEHDVDIVNDGEHS